MKVPSKNSDNKEIKVAIIGVIGAVLTAIVVNWGQYFFNPPIHPNTRDNPAPPAAPDRSPTISDNGVAPLPHTGEKENSTAGVAMNTTKEKALVPATPNTNSKVPDAKQKQQISPTAPQTTIGANRDIQRSVVSEFDAQCGPSIETSVAVDELKKLAQKGCHLAEFRLGTIYLYGVSGIAEDKTEAFVWMKKSAEGNIAGAQHNLGVMYQKGFGVKKDMQLAVAWYQKAARQGRIDSQNVLKDAHITW
jgi:hypothetical protein